MRYALRCFCDSHYISAVYKESGFALFTTKREDACTYKTLSDAVKAQDSIKVKTGIVFVDY
jgi:hypothetical protein